MVYWLKAEIQIEEPLKVFADHYRVDFKSWMEVMKKAQSMHAFLLAMIS